MAAPGKRSSKESGRLRRLKDLLPPGLQMLFSVLTAWLLVIEFGPVMTEYRRAGDILEQQQSERNRLVTELADRRRRLRSLLFDPQTIERARDEKGMQPDRDARDAR